MVLWSTLVWKDIEERPTCVDDLVPFEVANAVKDSATDFTGMDVSAGGRRAGRSP